MSVAARNLVHFMDAEWRQNADFEGLPDAKLWQEIIDGRPVDTIPYGLYSLSMKTTTRPTSKGAEEARQQLPAILSAAESGRTTLITRHGRSVAAVVPASAVKRSAPMSLLALAGTGRGMWGQGSARTVARLRDEWNR